MDSEGETPRADGYLVHGYDSFAAGDLARITFGHKLSSSYENQ